MSGPPGAEAPRQDTGGGRQVGGGWFPRLLLAALLLLPAALALARQDPPQFDDYAVPVFGWGLPDGPLWAWLDVGLYAAACLLAAWVVLGLRSRRWTWILMIACLAWFGFVRHGCGASACPIGATGLVGAGLFVDDAFLPASTVLLFVVPLVAALLWGRVFCGAVCPLGAVQDVLAVKSWRLPGWLEHCLSLLAYVYLGLALLFVATGCENIICRYDPFVGIFRLAGDVDLMLLGAVFVVLSMFIGRPYCRFLCPYGVLLRLVSYVSVYRLRIYPDECVNCRLCENSCPYGAINPSDENAPKGPRTRGKGTLIATLLLLPALMGVFGFAGSRLAGPLSYVHRDVRLALLVEQAKGEGRAARLARESDEMAAFRGAQGTRTEEELTAAVAEIRWRFRLGTWLLGAWVGLVVGAKLIALSLRRRRDSYEADAGSCLSCARCYAYCPGSTGCAPGPVPGDEP